MSIFNQKKKTVWIQKTHFLRADEFICSVCGYKSKIAKKTCPNCGEHLSKIKYDASWVDEAELIDMILEDWFQLCWRHTILSTLKCKMKSHWKRSWWNVDFACNCVSYFSRKTVDCTFRSLAEISGICFNCAGSTCVFAVFNLRRCLYEEKI